MRAMSLHHPPSDFLVAYAAGSLPEPQSLLIATHLALCSECRDLVSGLDAVGGVLLDRLPPAEVSPEALDMLIGRLDEPAPAPAAPPIPRDPVLPAPLRAYVGRDSDRIAWRRLSLSVEEFVLPIPATAGFSTRLLRIAAGGTVPSHTHEGSEMTLVLSGAFSDENGRYARGDIAAGDPSIEHRPVADPDGACICLSVVEGRLRFSGIFGPLLNLWNR